MVLLLPNLAGAPESETAEPHEDKIVRATIKAEDSEITPEAVVTKQSATRLAK